MKEAIIHLGMAKTGTTSIQQSLFLNCDFLRANKVFYPRFVIDGRSHGLYACHIFQSITRNYDEIAPFWKLRRSRRDLTTFGVAALDRLLFDFQQSGCSRLLISSELLLGDYLTSFCKIIGAEVDAVRGVLTVRAPRSRFQSEFQQGLRGGVFLATPRQVRERIARVADLFPVSLIVKRYIDKDDDPSWNAVDDFWSDILHLAPDRAVAKTLNDADPSEVSIVFAEMTRFFVQSTKEERIRFFGWCRHMVKSADLRALKFTKFELSESIQRRVDVACASDTQWLFEQYGIEWTGAERGTSSPESAEIISSAGQLRDNVGFYRESCMALSEHLLQQAEKRLPAGVDQAVAKAAMLSAIGSFR